jgi:hypothetical protein
MLRGLRFDPWGTMKSPDDSCALVTIFRTLLTRGYFPKELPPAFFTEQFASYANTKSGRQQLASYKPAGNYTECVRYQLALPGLHRRELRIPHPASFSQLAAMTSKNFGRLLKKASRSPFSKSRPIYAVGRHRALLPSLKPSNLGRERAALRGGSSYLLKADVSQFYPSLYTHAVGWAIDPKLRDKAHWKNQKLLGKKVDQALMDLDGKVSQGIPIGNDISFLLAESVLAQVDAAISAPAGHAFRWFDDYELSFDTRDEAEACMKRLSRELSRFRLRLNPSKTKIAQLPQAAEEEWQELLIQTGGHGINSARQMVKHFDLAFRLRDRFPDSPVLLYALGILFGMGRPTPEVGRIAQSCLTQAILSEPGAAQKGFALLSYWRMNGFLVDTALISTTINRLILRHEAGGLSSDVAWALSYCLEQKFSLDGKAGRVLSSFDDDCIALQALHMAASGLLPKGFGTAHISKVLKNADMDREHWLIAYEAVRQGFSNDSKPAVTSNSMFSDLLNRKVTFYRTRLPAYASVVHPGGAPDWVVSKWMDLSVRPGAPSAPMPAGAPVPKPIEDDLKRLKSSPSSDRDAVVGLLDLFGEEFAANLDELSYPI